ncbi:DUF1800 domain-containing protein [Paracoccus siganidrum]|nr:DUF1800 domain-containing protein [Paracoccus siganidrum]
MVAYPELAAIRLGFGLSPLIPPPTDAAAVLASVASAAPDAHAVRTQDFREATIARAELVQKARDGDEAARQEAQRQRDEVVERNGHAVQRRFARAVGDPAGFGERLVQFWADHFTVRGGNPFQILLANAFIDEAIRPHLNGHFADLLFAADTHPMMLGYLDQNSSVGPRSRSARNRPDRKLGLNENLAREMIELHTLGVDGDYGQRDVRQLAKLLTGLRFNARRDEIFLPQLAEPGAETVLGKSYGGDGEADLGDIRAAMTDLALHPSTAEHLSRKLVVHFVDDDPPEDLVRRLTAAWQDSDGHLPALYAILVEAPELETHFRKKVRQPFDFIVASVRALGLTGDDVLGLELTKARNWLQYPMTGMGQRWGMPVGPDGWPEGASSWATPQGLAARIQWSLRFTPRLQPDLPQPEAFLAAALGSTASEALQWAVPKAETAREAVMIVLASADFNRR